MTVTFNANQLRSHVAPLIAIPEVEEIVLVADEPPPALPKVRAVVPGPIARRALGRAGAKLAACVREARRGRPDWILSYSIMPHGINGHLAGRVSGARTMFHMIGGTEEWEGGGWASENPVLSRLPVPVPALERMLLRVVRGSTLVGTMGQANRARLVHRGFSPDRVVAVPPSVDISRFSPAAPGTPRPYDIVTVASLMPRKRLHDFLEIVRRLRRGRPNLRAAVAGDGPLAGDLRARAAEMGVADAVDFLGRRNDVENVYRMARVFVLTSQWEGLSVAMSEAMACGLPAVVTDVGDMRDLLHEGRNGHLLAVGDIDGFTARLGALLDDEGRLAAASAAAREDAARHSGVERMTRVYRQLLVEHDTAANGG